MWRYLFVLLLLGEGLLLGSRGAPLLPLTQEPADISNDVNQLSQEYVSQLTNDWRLIMPASPQHSYGFHNAVLNYTCPSVSCAHVPNMLRSALLHFVAGTEHKSNFPMMIYRTCEAFQWGIPPSAFRISLHYESRDEPKMYKPVLLFFRALRVDPVAWIGPAAHFTANTKMMHYLSSLRDLNDSARLVYHLDLDEFPDAQRCPPGPFPDSLHAQGCALPRFPRLMTDSHLTLSPPVSPSAPNPSAG